MELFIPIHLGSETTQPAFGACCRYSQGSTDATIDDIFSCMQIPAICGRRINLSPKGDPSDSFIFCYRKRRLRRAFLTGR